jgi:hypothetical protein
MEEFISLARIIQSIISNLNALYVAGYPKDVDLTQGKKFIFRDSNVEKISEFDTELGKILGIWTEKV